jgi:hypothetical protein
MMDMKVASDNVNWKAPLSLNEVVGKEWKCSQLIVVSQFKVLDIGFYVCTFIQSSSDSKSNPRYCERKPNMGSLESCDQTQLPGKMAPKRSNAARLYQRWQSLRVSVSYLGCTGGCWLFLRYLGKGGLNGFPLTALGLWFPWTESPRELPEK